MVPHSWLLTDWETFLFYTINDIVEWQHSELLSDSTVNCLCVGKDWEEAGSGYL